MSAFSKKIAIIGAGPSGLYAAECLAGLGHNVTVFERKPSPARKFLMAGRGGLNLTHSESLNLFIARYRDASSWMADAIQSFTPDDLRTWCGSLGIETFIGSSGRIFPKSMKASPLLRAWLARLDRLGVKILTRHDWHGWNSCGNLVFETPEGSMTFIADATLLALGGASWPSLGSDGSWMKIEGLNSLSLSPFRPSNCGFHVAWSDHLRHKFAGSPLKNIAVTCGAITVHGEAMLTDQGIEGGAIYALSSHIRDMIAVEGQAVISFDFRPLLSLEDVMRKLSASTRGRKSVSAHLQSSLNLSPIQIALLYECDRNLSYLTHEILAKKIKQTEILCTAPFSIERAISSAGGVQIECFDQNFMVKSRPGLFACGEMLDWEAPTGGYLIQGCFATAAQAAAGIDRWLRIPQTTV